MQEKRLFKRVTLNATVTFTTADDTRVSATALDLSLGGMFLTSEHKPNYGTQVTIEVQFPDEEAPMPLPATVRWVSADGFGVQFGLLGARATHRITQLAAQGS